MGQCLGSMKRGQKIQGSLREPLLGSHSAMSDSDSDLDVGVSSPLMIERTKEKKGEVNDVTSSIGSFILCWFCDSQHLPNQCPASVKLSG